MEEPMERCNCAAVETQTVVSTATLTRIEKRSILNRITLPKFGCPCCGECDTAARVPNADSFVSIDLTTPQRHKISSLNDTVSNMVQHNKRSTTIKRP